MRTEVPIAIERRVATRVATCCGQRGRAGQKEYQAKTDWSWGRSDAWSVCQLFANERQSPTLGIVIEAPVAGIALRSSRGNPAPLRHRFEGNHAWCVAPRLKKDQKNLDGASMPARRVRTSALADLQLRDEGRRCRPSRVPPAATFFKSGKLRNPLSSASENRAARPVLAILR